MILASLVIGQSAMFSITERANVLNYWSAPERYVVEKASADGKTSPFQIRLTVEGSKWLLEFRKATGQAKVASPDALPVDPERLTVWNAWINARVHWDRHIQYLRAEAQAKAAGRVPPIDEYPVDPPDPGPQPEDLLSFAGEPPSFAQIVEPNRYRITFEDGGVFTYEDNIKCPPNYAYYRYPEGVIKGGTPVKKLPDSELNRLAKLAGLDERTFRIMKAVSLLEGGFDSVNTYDTGFVSVGFIQFACLTAGAGSLGQVLQSMKAADPIGYEQHFRRFGIDVALSGALAVVDLGTGEERQGPEAAQTIIADKRLVAVFERAGQVSVGFRVAQLRVAHARYFPNDVLALNVNGKNVAVPVSDLFRSEAALATLMDRKVHTGNIRPLTETVQSVFDQNGLTSTNDFVDYERTVVQMMRHRKDFLADTSLSQPRLIASNTSRGGARPKQPQTPKGKNPRPPVKKKSSGNPASESPRPAVSDG